MITNLNILKFKYTVKWAKNYENYPYTSVDFANLGWKNTSILIFPKDRLEKNHKIRQLSIKKNIFQRNQSLIKPTKVPIFERSSENFKRLNKCTFVDFANLGWKKRIFIFARNRLKEKL